MQKKLIKVIQDESAPIQDRAGLRPPEPPADRVIRDGGYPIGFLFPLLALLILILLSILSV